MRADRIAPFCPESYPGKPRPTSSTRMSAIAFYDRSPQAPVHVLIVPGLSTLPSLTT